MLRKIRKGLACMMVLSFLFNFGVFASDGQNMAENDNENLDNACFRLLALDVIDESMIVKGENQITRGEFTHLILRLLDYDSSTVADSGESGFIDVANEYEYKKDIYLSKELNLVTGYSDGTFKPNALIKYEEVMSVLVKALGYMEIAQSSGGYPTGYLAVGAQINLLDNTVVKFGDSITYNDVFLIFDNALEVEILTKEIGSDGNLIKDGSTLLDIKMDAQNLIYGSGRLNKNNVTSLYSDDTNFSEDKVMIGEQYFYVGNTNAAEMLAYEVEYYAQQEQSNDIATLKSIKISRKSESMLLKADQIVSVTPSKITYDDKRTLNLGNELNIIYNAKLADHFTAENLMIKNGTLEAVDADGDGDYETIFVREYKIITVESVNVERERIYFKDQMLNGSKYLEYITDDDYDIKVYDASKEEISFGDIKADDVIEVYASPDGKIVRIYVIQNTVTGKIEEILVENHKTYVTIGETEYEINPDDIELDEKLILGTAGVFYVNSDNIIVKYTEDLEETNLQNKLALVQQVAVTGGIDAQVHLRLVNAGTGKTLEEDTDDDEILDTRYLEIKNSDVVIYECADNIMFNNNKIERAELPTYLKIDERYPKNNPVITYELNAENKINKIDVAQPYGGRPENKTLNIRAKLFGGSSNSFIMDSTTRFISVPPELTSGYEEELFLGVSKLEDGNDFEVMPLDVDADTKIAKAVVVVTPASVGASTINSRTKVSVISAVSQVLDDDQVVYKLSGFTGASSYSEFTTDDISNTFDDLETGDLILYSQDYRNRINNIEIVKKFKDLNEYYYSNKDEIEAYGKVVGVHANYVSDSATDLQNLITVDVSNSDTPHEVRMLFSATTVPPIYVYDSFYDEVYAGSITDIQSADYVGRENASEVFVLSSGGAVKAILVIDR